MKIIFLLFRSPKSTFLAQKRVLNPYWSLSVLRCDLEAARRLQKKERKKPKVRQKSLRPRRPTSTKFCMWGHVPDIFLVFEYQKDRLENAGAVWVKILVFPLTRHTAYTRACHYRTSRDKWTTLFHHIMVVNEKQKKTT